MSLFTKIYTLNMVCTLHLDSVWNFFFFSLARWLLCRQHHNIPYIYFLMYVLMWYTLLKSFDSGPVKHSIAISLLNSTMLLKQRQTKLLSKRVIKTKPNVDILNAFNISVSSNYVREFLHHTLLRWDVLTEENLYKKSLT